MLKTIGKKIIIKRDKNDDNKTNSGIVLTSKKEVPSTGSVIEVGKDCEVIKIGDKVMFYKYTAREIEHENEKFIIAEEDDILAIIE